MNNKAFISAAIVFLLCLLIGFWMAQHKPIWNDEFYTAVSSVDARSYADQFLGHIPEGNNTPLFYALQKSLCQMIHYHIPAVWKTGQWDSNRQAQIILRVIPVLCMSLSIALIFFYFARGYSLGWAIYSLFVFLSSYMAWAYWAEARPYPLIVLLTTVQSLFFLKIVNQPKGETQGWKSLAVVHLLLAFTFIFSIGQIVAASLMLWVKQQRSWKKYLFWTVLPVGIALFYYSHAPRYPFYFGLSPEQLIRDNFSRERFYILFVFIVLAAAYWLGVKRSWKSFFINQEIKSSITFVFFTVLTLLATAGVLGLFMLHQCQPGTGFPITSRYFIYLTPIGVIAATVMTRSIIHSLSGYRWLQWIMIGAIAVWVIPRFFKIVPKAIHSILGGQ
ncbi:MAG: hypothetical protein HQL15_00825 [Candidatus Omnitrophica bacterium]|nr:hypothetical protein [Candidatus Omnitrophota bacterium]